MWRVQRLDQTNAFQVPRTRGVRGRSVALSPKGGEPPRSFSSASRCPKCLTGGHELDRYFFHNRLQPMSALRHSAFFGFVVPKDDHSLLLSEGSGIADIFPGIPFTRLPADQHIYFVTRKITLNQRHRSGARLGRPYSTEFSDSYLEPRTQGGHSSQTKIDRAWGKLFSRDSCALRPDRPFSVRLSASLPVHLQRQLHLARRVGLAGHQAEGVAIQVRGRRPKHCAIEQIERLGAKIQAKALR
jgi:hypothetical protein